MRRPHLVIGMLLGMVLCGSALARSVVPCPAPAASTTWTPRMLGTNALDYAEAVATDSGLCAILVAGYTTGSLTVSAGSIDGYLARYSTNGSLVWIQQVGTEDSDYITGVTVDADHNVYVVGYTYAMMPGAQMFNLGCTDIFVGKYDRNGALLWMRQFGSIDDDFGNDIAVSPSGGVYITGRTDGALLGMTHHGGRDYFLARYDADGALQLVVQLGTANDEIGSSVAVGPAGNVYVAGTTDGTLGPVAFGNSDMFVAKHDENGNQLWLDQRGTASVDLVGGIAVGGNGEVYVAGSADGGLDGNAHLGFMDIVLVHYDSNGNWRWTKQRGSGSTDVGKGVALGTDGAIYLAGYSGDSFDGGVNAGSDDVVVIKHGRGGAWQWTTFYGNSSVNFPADIDVNTSDHVYVVGYGDGALGGVPNAGSLDVFALKFGSDGAVQ